MARVIHGDCLEVMRDLKAEGVTVQAIVTDPPYGLSFMGKNWDHGIPGVPYWQAAYDLLPPGGHLLAFGGTRTFHRMACAIEDAGFDIRDTLMWMYGTGFPKSHDVSKKIDKAAGAEREVISTRTKNTALGGNDLMRENGRATGAANFGVASGDFRVVYGNVELPVTAPATDAAREWQGWGTALKPAWEPIIMARKPLVGTVAQNVQAYGTGAINVDACRVEGGPIASAGGTRRSGGIMGVSEPLGGWTPTHSGRWPANVVHDGSAEVDAAFAAFGESKARHAKSILAGGTSVSGEKGQSNCYGAGRLYDARTGYADEATSVSRFFYSAKASKADRYNSKHPTVKPVALMQWLVRMVTPKGGMVLDPFAGSGTTLQAAVLEGFAVIGIEKEAEYVEDIKNRMDQMRKDLFMEAGI